MSTTFVVNYTPHTVHLLHHDGSPHMTFYSSGIARATESNEPLPPLDWDPFGDCGMRDHLPLVRRTFGAVEGLPEPRDGVAYIVSQIVADACPDRTDLLVPALVERDAAGQVVGCRAFAMNARGQYKISQVQLEETMASAGPDDIVIGGRGHGAFKL